MTSWESIIGDAMLNGDHDQAERRITVKQMVCTYHTCRCCQKILDQQTSIATELGGEDGPWLPVTVTCKGKCSELARATVKHYYLDNDAHPTTKTRGVSWDETEWEDSNE
jgi:hypothetical protein